MKKFGLVLAAIGALAVAVPSLASAQTVVIKRGGGHHHMDRGWGSHAEMRRDRGWHRDRHHRHHDRVVVIKRHRY